ncbi:MAG: HNH endonuclease [Myxococcaceae bacterium]|nr:HNH endonuclease [Myxococcaceae bacterium]
MRHTASDRRAPHKPLVLLDALARVSRGDARLTRFGDIEQHLSSLLARFGAPGASSHRPQYAFYRLRNDHGGRLWELEPADLRRHENASGDVPLSALRGASGGFPADVHALLAGDLALLNGLTSVLLEEFAESLRPEILDAIELHWTPLVAPRRPRSGSFREDVLRSYGRRCCVCEFDGRLGADDEFALEAAHIVWHAYGGRDEVPNGLALCTFHHKAFDRGALSIGDDLRLLVSEDLSGANTALWLRNFAGRPLVLPRRTDHHPRLEHLRWHRREVFRAGRDQPA